MDTTLLLAIATFVLALFAALSAGATVVLAYHNRQMVKANRELVEQNRQLVEQGHIAVRRPYYVELIALIIDPLLGGVEALSKTHKSKGYHWGSYNKEYLNIYLDGDLLTSMEVELFQLRPEAFYLPLINFDLEWSGPILHETLYRDLLQEHGELSHFIETYNRGAKALAPWFMGLATWLLSPEIQLKKNVERGVKFEYLRGQPEYDRELQENTIYCAEELFKAFLGCSQLAGPKRVKDFLEEHGQSLLQRLRANKSRMDERQRVCQLADDLVKHLDVIRGELERTRDRYRHDFAITDDMIKTAKAKPS